MTTNETDPGRKAPRSLYESERDLCISLEMQGHSLVDLGTAFNVSKSTVGNAVSGASRVSPAHRDVSGEVERPVMGSTRFSRLWEMAENPPNRTPQTFRLAEEIKAQLDAYKVVTDAQAAAAELARPRPGTGNKLTRVAANELLASDDFKRAVQEAMFDGDSFRKAVLAVMDDPTGLEGQR